MIGPPPARECGWPVHIRAGAKQDAQVTIQVRSSIIASTPLEIAATCDCLLPSVGYRPGATMSRFAHALLGASPGGPSGHDQATRRG